MDHVGAGCAPFTIVFDGALASLAPVFDSSIGILAPVCTGSYMVYEESS